MQNNFQTDWNFANKRNISERATHLQDPWSEDISKFRSKARENCFVFLSWSFFGSLTRRWDAIFYFWHRVWRDLDQWHLGKKSFDSEKKKLQEKVENCFTGGAKCFLLIHNWCKPLKFFYVDSVHYHPWPMLIFLYSLENWRKGSSFAAKINGAWVTSKWHEHRLKSLFFTSPALLGHFNCK